MIDCGLNLPKRVTIRDRRPSFTLIELMVVISILAILSTVVLFGLYGVMEDAKAALRSQITRLHEVIMAKWEGYATRALRVNLPRNLPLPQVAAFRLHALRDLMRLELPDRISDVMEGPVQLTVGGQPIQFPDPAIHKAYLRRSVAAGSNWSTQHQGAECLYLIVATSRLGDRAAIEFFQEKEIGDYDGDGMLEIWDAWGKPIEFLRWAPGYESDLQPRDSAVAPDPFDPAGVDNRGTYRLVPLIFSAGVDQIYDIATENSPPVSYKSLTPPNDPYYSFNANPCGTSIQLQFGASFDSDCDGELNSLDNITNHLLEANL